MLPLLQLVGVAVTPLKVTVLSPCVAPKLEPLTVTEVPIEPLAGDRFAMLGCGVGRVTLIRESQLVSKVSSPFTRLFPAPVATFTPTHRKNRSVDENVMAVDAEQVMVCWMRVVLRANGPMALQIEVPDGAFAFNSSIQLDMEHLVRQSKLDNLKQRTCWLGKLFFGSR